MEVSWGCPCGAQLRVIENRLDYDCFNCGRKFGPSKEGVVEIAPPSKTYQPITKSTTTFDNPATTAVSVDPIKEI